MNVFRVVLFWFLLLAAGCYIMFMCRCSTVGYNCIDLAVDAPIADQRRFAQAVSGLDSCYLVRVKGGMNRWKCVRVKP